MAFSQARFSLISLALVPLLAACGSDTTGGPGTATQATDTTPTTPTDTTPTDTTPTDTAGTETVATDTSVEETAAETTEDTGTDTTKDDTTVTDTATTETTVADTTPDSEVSEVSETTETGETSDTGSETETTAAECGNGRAERGELCDKNDLAGASCGSLGFDPAGSLKCSADCKDYVLTGCQPDCGNGALDASELCDGATIINDATCADLGYDGGALGCAANCLGADVSTCTTTEVCGNNSVGGPEACDGSDLGVDPNGDPVTCESFGYAAGGTLHCRADCGNWDVTGCGEQTIRGWTCPPIYYGDGTCDCGCGIVDSDCTGGVTACEYCNDPGSCATNPGCGDISAANLGVCTGTVVACGNGTAGPGEACDGDDLRGATCLSLGYTGGTLACSAACGLDATGCERATIPTDWQCDASYYGDGTCDCGCGAQDVDCASTTDVAECDYCDACAGTGDCTTLVSPTDTTTCESAVPSGWTCNPSYYGDGDCDCGCGVQDLDCSASNSVALCDFCGACQTNGEDCATVVDNANTTACVPTSTCGNALVEGREDCDGLALGGASCASLGYASGDLGCNADCTFDLRACVAPGVPVGWTCDVTYYGDGACDCGCGAQDLDCTGTEDVSECAYCLDCPGTGECTGRVDNLDTTQCGGAIAGWTCDPSWFGDGDCDCGCGAQDKDCADTTDASACAYCLDCGLSGDCTTLVDNSDTTQCAAAAVPAGWICDASWYGDGSCDCGCGAQDFDCAGTTDALACDYCLGCGGDFGATCVGLVDATDTTQCAATTCGDRIVSGSEACDGDNLAGASCLSLGFDGGTLGCNNDCTFDTVGCTRPTVPNDWTCPASYFGDNECDCGCGAKDIDCQTTSEIRECAACSACPGAGDCSVRVDASDTTLCSGVVIVPTGWTCNDTWYADGNCDCGCGIQDFDCQATDDVTECAYCGACAGQGDCTTLVDDLDTTLCANPVPGTWTCSQAYYGDGTCDCGCGAQDLDCASTTDAAACTYCESCGVAAGGACTGAVDTGDTTLCTDAAPPGWTCAAGWYSDGDCDCGCGIKDADCASATDASACDFCVACYVMAGDSCVGAVVDGDTTQCEAVCGNGVIDSGEACEKSDLGGATCASRGFLGGTLGCSDTCGFDTSLCIVPPTPDAWTCPEAYFGDGSCDCGCGAADVDCAASDDASECAYCTDCAGTGACDARVDHYDTTLCLPDGWRCDAMFYDDLDCDCGCGAQDLDCNSTTSVAECVFCDQCGAGLGDACGDFVSTADTTLCLAECGNGVVDVSEACDGGDLDGESCLSQGFAGGVLACDSACAFDTSGCLTTEPPLAWACAASWYGDGTCDCGCGAQDLDCAGTTDASECTYCIDCPGTGACTTRVDTRDTTLCAATPGLPAAWACPEAYFGDGTCDCGCGGQDSDCAGTSDVSECLYCDQCGVTLGDACTAAVTPGDTTSCQ